MTGSPGGSAVKKLLAMQEMQETQVRSLGWEDPLKEGMATYSSILTWRIQWTEEPGGLQSVRLQGWTQLKKLSTHSRWTMNIKYKDSRACARLFFVGFKIAKFQNNLDVYQ